MGEIVSQSYYWPFFKESTIHRISNIPLLKGANAHLGCTCFADNVRVWSWHTACSMRELVLCIQFPLTHLLLLLGNQCASINKNSGTVNRMTRGAENQLESTWTPLQGFLLKFSWALPDAGVMERKTWEDALFEGRDCISSCSAVITEARREAGEHSSLKKSLVNKNTVCQALWEEFSIRSFLWYSQNPVQEGGILFQFHKETKAVRVAPFA